MILQILPAVAAFLLIPLHSSAFVSVGRSLPPSLRQRKADGSSTSLYSFAKNPNSLERMEPHFTTKIQELPIRSFPQKENLVDRDRRGYEPADGIFVDVEGALSPELMNEMKQKAMLTLMTYMRIEPTFEFAFTSYGQGGLFRDKGEPVVVTARHTIQDYYDPDDGYFNRFEGARCKFVDGFGAFIISSEDLSRQNVKGENITFDDGDKWDNYDFAMSSSIQKGNEKTHGKFFEWVTEDFVLEPGMKVGMVVKRSEKQKLTWNSTTASKFKQCPVLNKVVDLLPLMFGLEDRELLEIFGRSENVCFYTGEITSVMQNERAFKHDINSFRGCSGATIFLLDQGNEGLVGPENYGKAVGVHAGGLDGDNNLGFSPDKVN